MACVCEIQSWIIIWSNFVFHKKNSNIAIVNYTLTIETIQNTKIYSFCCHFLLTTLNKSLNILMSATTPFLHLFRTGMSSQWHGCQCGHTYGWHVSTICAYRCDMTKAQWFRSKWVCFVCLFGFKDGKSWNWWVDWVPIEGWNMVFPFICNISIFLLKWITLRLNHSIW